LLACSNQELVDSDCWKKASEERTYVLRRAGSNVGRGLQKEFDTWMAAQEHGMLDALG
jgi:hypothetical protein